MRAAATAGLAALAALAGCSFGKRCPDMAFERLRSADRVRVRVGAQGLPDSTEHTITDAAAIARIVAFAEARPDGWGVPWYGAPVAHADAAFYEGGRFLGDLGAGHGFLTAQGCGWFQSRSATRDEVAELLTLLGAEPRSAR